MKGSTGKLLRGGKSEKEKIEQGKMKLSCVGVTNEMKKRKGEKEKKGERNKEKNNQKS